MPAKSAQPADGALDDLEAEMEGEEAAPCPDDLETDDDEVAAAAQFFRAQRTTRRNKIKRSLSSLPGGEAEELTDCVHRILDRALKSASSGAEYESQYPEWLSTLACGCSLLLHGFGSKRLVLRDFGSALAASAPVVTLDGSSSSARVRDLLLTLLQQVLCVRDISGRSNSSLIKLIRAAFAAHEAAKPPAPLPDFLMSHIERLLPNPPAKRESKSFDLEPLEEYEHELDGDTANSQGGDLENPDDEYRPEEDPQSANSQGGHLENPDSATDEDDDGDDEAAAYARKAEKEARRAVELERHAAELEQLELPKTCHVPHAVDSATGRAGGASVAETTGVGEIVVADRAGADSRQRAKWPTGKRELAVLLESQSNTHDMDLISRDAGAGGGRRLRRRHSEPTAGTLCELDERRRQVNIETVYVIVHDIDGQALRGEASQTALAALAAIPQVRFIASCNHRNTALLWDAQKARSFGWQWVEISTAEPYAHETKGTIHELLTGLQDAAHGAQSSSALTVLQQLTDRAKKAFVALCEFQLKNPASAGLSLPEWCALGRDKWFATQESALRIHIGEYQTHNLVRMRPAADGQQCYYCALPISAMNQIVARLSV